VRYPEGFKVSNSPDLIVCLVLANKSSGQNEYC
jgi:hypothetical protein